MERSPDRKCETCVYWRPNTADRDTSEYGSCVRYPPGMVGGFHPHDASSEEWSGSPNVHADSWCGEHRTQQMKRTVQRATQRLKPLDCKCGARDYMGCLCKSKIT